MKLIAEIKGHECSHTFDWNYLHGKALIIHVDKEPRRQMDRDGKVLRIAAIEFNSATGEVIGILMLCKIEVKE